jgi:hypothetical protein
VFGMPQSAVSLFIALWNKFQYPARLSQGSHFAVRYCPTSTGQTKNHKARKMGASEFFTVQ